MDKSGFSEELADICRKYERLKSLVCMLQVLTSTKVGIDSVPGECVSGALFEVELEMGKANDRLKAIMEKGENNEI